MLGSLACQLCRACHYLAIACWIHLQAHVLANASNMQWQNIAQVCCNDLLPLYVGAGACKGTQHKMANSVAAFLSCVAILCWAGACNGTQHKLANIVTAFLRCVAILCWAPLRASFVTLACWIPLKHTCLRTHQLKWQANSAMLLQRFVCHVMLGQVLARTPNIKWQQIAATFLICVAILYWAGACNGTQHKMAKHSWRPYYCFAIVCWAPLHASFHVCHYLTIACWIPLKHTCLRTHQIKSQKITQACCNACFAILCWGRRLQRRPT